MITFLRSFLFFVGMVALTPPFTVLALLAAPLPALTRYRMMTHWARWLMPWLTLTCGIRYRVRGLENVPADRPVVFLAKHQSAWETLAFQAILPPHAWVLKRELLHIPFFGWGLAMMSPIAINRAAGKQALRQVTEQGRKRLADGFSVLVFPEGTRTPPGQKGHYHIGGAFLAAQTGATVVPIAHNAGECWGKNAFVKRPGTITVSIGAPLSAAGLKADALNQQVEAWIEGEMATLPPVR